MTLSHWHSRPGGRWRVDDATQTLYTGYVYHRYEWRAQTADGRGSGVGYAGTPWQARAAAIAALRTMANG
jgi:hypothetical protein